jgi:hypothetical protein
MVSRVHATVGIPAAPRAVRNWLSNAADLRASGPTLIWNRFNEFMADDYDQLTADGHSDRDIERLPVAELIGWMQSWVETNRPS